MSGTKITPDGCADREGYLRGYEAFHAGDFACGWFDEGRKLEVDAVSHYSTGEARLDFEWRRLIVCRPKMSAGNVAWGNGRFNHLEPSSYFSKIRNETVPTAVYGEPESRNFRVPRLLSRLSSSANYANPYGQAWLLEVMTRIMPIYESLFDLAFPLPKLNWMATPAFNGAIEHWGLITGNSLYTTWYQGKGEASKHAIADHVSHEVAHQWYACPFSLGLFP